MSETWRKLARACTRLGAGLLVCLSSHGAIAQAVANRQDAEILIGQSCQLTGPLAALSNEVRQGAQLYFDRVNASGGIHGRKIRVIALDDAYDPQRAAENTRTLIQHEKVLALFQYAGTPPSMAAVPIAEAFGVPFITPFSGADPLRQNFSRYVFNIKAGYSSELDAMVRQLAVVGITKVAAVYLNNPFGIGGLASVERSAAVHQISLVARVPLAVDGAKLDTVVAEVAKSSPQAIIVISAGKPSIDFVDAYLKAGHRSTFYMLSVISNLQLESALGKRSRGIVISQVVPSPWNRSIAVSREFQALAAAKGLGEYSFSQMEGFISAKFLVEAVKRAGSKPTREGLLQALESMSRVDLGGYAVDMSPSQHSSGRYVDLVIVGRDGRFTR
ncbi:MAG: ABC transporter substrate-binding protein [Hydrogenophaga sp.]|uniref:ABC transporter substrate-binding protein n=1 Tax=Hydrogenophaga sp. TaxID=1904254 RepID=UPI001DAC3A77|nr:ABC transporter substrate-binding protein [Hydrogenophaga sp.]MBW0172678.1 ABC transporter substrate-binding protein [Hydrogenophaga sp.]MBW0183648.1 ABC transporter substrate-binding protein [Hydrogenophaga sp.]